MIDLADPPVRLPPTWMVSTPHARVVTRGGQKVKVPFQDVHHARQLGRVTTACGRAAASWVNFYTLAFDINHPQSCRACVAATHE